MRRRFGRRRQGGGEPSRSPLDANDWLERIAGEAAAPLQDLAALELPGLPPWLAVVAEGREASGAQALLAFSPHAAGDALLAALAAAGARGAEEPFQGALWVAAPEWSLSARRRLALVGETPFSVRPLELPALGENVEPVQPEPLDEPWVVSHDQLAARLAVPAERELALRAMGGLAGLAAKHGGTLRTHGRSVELVLFARRAAAVRVDEDGVVLEAILPQRRSERLAADGLGDALDRLEGGLRKRLHDRDVRDGEEGLRARALRGLSDQLGLRDVHPWPCGGADLDALDLLGVDPGGQPVVAVIRRRVGLEALGAVLDAWLELRAGLPVLLADAAPPLRLDAAKLLLAAPEIEPAVRHVTAWLALETAFVELSPDASELRDAGSAGGRPSRRRAAARATPAPRERGREEPRERGREEPREGPEEPGDGRDEPREARRGRRRRGRGRGGDSGADGRAGAWAADAAETGAARPEPQAGFEEVSLFDLDLSEDSGGGRDDGAGRRRRRRRRGRGRGGDGEPRAGGDGGDEQGREADSPRAGPERRPRRAPSSDEEDDLPGVLASLAPDPPDEATEEPELRYDDEEPEETDPEAERMHRERELRRRARVAKAAPEIHEEVRKPKPQRPRRVAILAHADRDSVAAAVIRARDLRMLEGIWIYPQSDLMTFFRGVATDLREDAPIEVIGFSASPARDVLQAAALYRDRLSWFDHHVWPPEDVERMREAIGAEALQLTPGAHSTLPAVLGACTRRSRFSDKLVDLVCARFTQHDYERWGRLWWSRLDEVAARTGERRADLEPLLAGRPSDLAREAEAAATPPPPAEVEYVAGRDFRIVHFGGLGLVVVPVPAGMDLHLSARIARERYGVALSLAWCEGEDVVVLAAEEAPGRRPLDVLAMTEHLVGKHDWIDALPDADHVARVGVRRLAMHPERVDELLAEVAMGRSILEG